MRRFLPLIAVGMAALAIGYAVGRPQDEQPAAARSAATAIETPAAEAPPAPVPGAPTASAGQATPMTESSFWSLVADTRAQAGGNTERQSDLLEERLDELSDDQQKTFDRIRHELDAGAYTWDLWGAAYVIEDGCSDDCFQDFRMYLISLGPDRYEAALRDPDSLASVVQDPEAGQWDAALDAGPGNFADLSGEPRGEPWDDEDQDELVQRYRRLAERFR